MHLDYFGRTLVGLNPPRVTAVVVAVLACFVPSPRARADLPAPEGLRNVGYAFEVEGSVPPHFALLAYPLGTPSPAIEIGHPYPLWQGYRPKLYAVLRDKVGQFPSTGEPGATEAWLTATALPCSDEVPRVFRATEASGIVSILDELRVEALDDKSCRIAPIRSKYRLQSGKELEGTFRDGRRVPPPELAAAFGEPDAGGSAVPAKSRGCAGCSVLPSDAPRDSAYSALLVIALAALRRFGRDARSRQSPTKNYWRSAQPAAAFLRARTRSSRVARGGIEKCYVVPCSPSRCSPSRS